MFVDRISVGLGQYDRTLKVHLWSPMWWIQDGQQILFKTLKVHSHRTNADVKGTALRTSI